MAAYVALLRGINVGGKHVLPMKALVAIFERLGCAAVRTYIQSGNVVFVAPAALARRVPAEVARAVERQFGFSAPVVTRSARQFAAVLDSNPFLAEGADPRTLHVAFMTSTPAATAVRALDPDRSPGDRFRVSGREVYLHLPNGVARSKLTNRYLDTTLATTCTARNWATVRKLAALT